MIQARLPHQPGQDDSGRSETAGFVRKTYAVFSQALAGMALCGVAAFTLLPEQAFLPVAILDVILWIACGWFGLRNPVGLIFPLFVIVTGAFLGLLAERYVSLGLGGIFLNAALVTVAAFMALTVYVFITRRNFNGLIGFLFAGFWILIVGMILRLFIDLSWLHFALSLFGAIVFSAWILFDTSRIVRRADPSLTPGTAAFELFLDIVGLFSYILNLMDLGD